MQQVSEALYLGRQVMTLDEVKELWSKYQEAEAELHWIMPPVNPFTALDPRIRVIFNSREEYPCLTS